MESKYRGAWVPGEVFQLVADGVLLAQEAMLLLLIETMVTPECGCWASNATLGEKMSLSGNRTREIIAKLVGLGLVSRTTGPHPCGEGESRFLLTAWSRLTLLGGKGGAGVSAGGSRCTGTKRLSTSYLSSTRVRKAKVQDVTAMENESMLFPEHAPQTPTTPSPEDLANAKTLTDTLRHHSRITGARSIKRQAEAFRLLRTTDNVTDVRIATVLQWYVANATAQYTPHVYNGDMFRKKFLQIEAASKRTGDAWVAPSTTPITITPLANTIYARSGLTFRDTRDVVDTLPFIQRCCDVYSDWCTRARAYVRTNGDEVTPHGRACRHLGRVIEPVEVFVGKWLADIVKIAYTWEAYKPGTLTASWVIRTDKEKFQKQVRGWLTAYSPDTKLANKIMEGINAS